MGKKRIKLARRVKRLVAAGLVGCLLYGECMQVGAIEPLEGWSAVEADAELPEEDYADSGQDAEEASDYDSGDDFTQELPEEGGEEEIIEEENDEEDADEEVTAGDEGEIVGDEEIVGDVENDDDGEVDEDIEAENDIPQVYAESPDVLRVEAESCGENHEGFNINESGTYIDGMKGTAWAKYSIDLGDKGGYNQIGIPYGAWDKTVCTVRVYLGEKSEGNLLGEAEFAGNDEAGNWNMDLEVICYVPGLAEKTGFVDLVIEWVNPAGGNLMNVDYFELSKEGKESIGEHAWNYKEDKDFSGNQWAGDRDINGRKTHIYVGGGCYTSYKLDFGKGGFNEVVLTGVFGGDCSIELHLGSSTGEQVGTINFDGDTWNQDNIILTNTVTQKVSELAKVTGEQDVYFVFKSGDYNFASFRFIKGAGEIENPGGDDKPDDDNKDSISVDSWKTSVRDFSAVDWAGDRTTDGKKTHIAVSSGCYAGYEVDFGNGGFNEITLTGDFVGNCKLELRLDSPTIGLVRTFEVTGGNNWNEAGGIDYIQNNTITYKVPELAKVTGKHVVYLVFKSGNYNFAGFRFNKQSVAQKVQVEAEDCIGYDGFNKNSSGTYIDGMNDGKAWASYNVNLGEGGYNQISILYGSDSNGGTVRFYLCGKDYSDGENYKDSGKLLGETEFEGTGGWNMDKTVECYVPDLTEVTGNVKLVIEWESPDGGSLMNADYFELSADGQPEEEEPEPVDTEGGLKVEAEKYKKGENVSVEGNHLSPGSNKQAWAMYRVDLGTGGYNGIALHYAAWGSGTIEVKLWLGDDFKTLIAKKDFERTGDWSEYRTVEWDVPELEDKTGFVYLVLEWETNDGNLMNPDYFKLFRDEEPGVDENIVYIEAEDYVDAAGLIKEPMPSEENPDAVPDHLGGLQDHSWAKYTVDLGDGGYNQFTIRYGAWGSGGYVRLWLNEKESGVMLGETAFRGTGDWSIYDTVSINVPKLAGETGLVTLVVEWECFAGSTTLMNPEHYELSINSKLPEENEDNDDNLTIQEKAEKGLASFLDAYYVKNRYTQGVGRFNGANFWDSAEMFEIVIDAYEHTGEQEYLDIIYEFFNGFKKDRGDDWKGNKFNDDIAWMVIACARAYLNTGDEEFLDVAEKNFDTVWNRGWDDTFLGGGIWWTTDKHEKNACVNGPMAVAACLLGEATEDKEAKDSYYEKAKQIIDWMAKDKNLYEEDTGKVYDNRDIEGGINYWSSTYNQGTFIGANALLYAHYGDEDGLVYYTRARKAADYTIKEMYKGGVMNNEADSDDLVGFKGILARWMCCFNEKCNEPDVMEWLLKNAESAWKNRNSYGLMGTQFGIKTWDDWDEGKYSTAFNASSAVSVLFNCWSNSSQEPEEPDPSPSPSPDPSPSPEPDPSPSPDPDPSPSPEPVPSPSPNPTEGPTPSPSPNPTEGPTPSPSPNPTEEPTPSPSPNPTEGPTPSPSPIPTEEPTPSPTPTVVPTPTPDERPETPEKVHTYGEPQFVWNSDDSVSAVFTCIDGDDSYTVEAVVTSNTENGVTVYVASVTGTDGITYTSTKTVVAVESDTEEAENLRAVVAEGVDEIPESLIEAGLDTEEKIEDVLFENLLVEESYTAENSMVYDVVLQISEDTGNTWIKVDPENFPAEGIVVMLPYPEGTDKEGYDFIVAHMFTIAMNGNQPGDVEILAVTKTDAGLQFTVTSLSPIAVSWKAITTEAPDTEVENPDVDPENPEDNESEEPDDTETPDDNEEPDDSETPNDSEEPDDSETSDNTEEPDDSETPDDSEEPDDTETPDDTKEPDDSETPDDTEEPDDSETPDDTEIPDDSETSDDSEAPENPEDGKDSTPKTGDSSSWFTWLMLCGFSACMLTILAGKERKKTR